ncbi:MAG: amidohydrolase family protein, partial [Thermoplasmata archaeon]
QDPDTLWVQFRDERGTEAANMVFLSHKLAMPCSDAEVYGRDVPKGPHNAPPPTAYGLFPHYLRLTVNEKRIMTIEEAIRKSTSLVAERMGISGRGVLKEGLFADIVLFDRDSIRERGDFIEPAIPPVGIDTVVVNGRIVYDKGDFAQETPGKVLRL